MHRKILKDIECMSGTGWVVDDLSYECQNCGATNNRQIHVHRFICDECGYSSRVEYGQQHLMRITSDAHHE